jgi:hypothetical protein
MNGKMFMGRRIKTGRSFAKHQNMGMQPPRNPMYNMMGRGGPPMNMGRGMHVNMGMGRPMMPYPRQPYMMSGQNMNPNHRNNMMHQKQRGSFHDQSHLNDRQEGNVNPNEMAHYRKMIKKVSPDKKTSYMISSKDKQSPTKKDTSDLKRVKKEETKYDPGVQEKFELKLIKEDEPEKKENKKEKEKINLDDQKEKITKEKKDKKETESKEESISKKGKKETGSETNISKGLLNKREEMNKDEKDTII